MSEDVYEVDEAAIKSNAIKEALNVHQIHHTDTFLMDNWENNFGLAYLTGAYFIAEMDDGERQYIHVVTLDDCSYQSTEVDYITDAFVSQFNRLQTLWESGHHAKFNSPDYYIDWAISKRVDIPWLNDAIEQGFYEKPKPLQAIEKPLNLSFDKTSNTYPEELDLAIQAWQAVSASEGKGKPKARIKTWLNTNTKISNEAKERIAIVANWDKTGGATSTG